ncbi:hypothetical protein IMSAGC006_01986 [Muribaculaceae bacterium]|nr:hypothetical protein IMSAGC006_01986 [Muribaculaceae bacterium]
MNCDCEILSHAMELDSAYTAFHAFRQSLGFNCNS